MPNRYDRITVTGKVTDVIRSDGKIYFMMCGKDFSGYVYLDGEDRHLADMVEIGDTVTLSAKVHQFGFINVTRGKDQ